MSRWGGRPDVNEEVLASLAGRLGVVPTHVVDLASLDAGQLWKLDAAVASMVAAEDEAIETGVREVLESLPWPVHRAARSLLGVDG
jgi:hypothetical protein